MAGNKPDEGRESFKEQLDRAADESRESSQQRPNAVVEKITEYIPAASKILGPSHQQPDKGENSRQSVPGPPDRPEHDHKIAEFVRDQHRSNDETLSSDN